MSNHHEMRQATLDFGDNLVLIVCDICGRSISFDSDDKGNLVPESLKFLNQGDLYVTHSFFPGGPGFTMSVMTEV